MKIRFNTEKYCKKFLEKSLLISKNRKKRKEKQYKLLFDIRNRIFTNNFDPLEKKFKYKISELPFDFFPNGNFVENSNRENCLKHYLRKKSENIIKFIKRGEKKRLEFFRNFSPSSLSENKKHLKIIEFSSRKFWLIFWDSRLDDENLEKVRSIDEEILKFSSIFINFLENLQNINTTKQNLMVLLLEKCPLDNLLIINKRNKKQIFFNRSKIFKNEILTLQFLKDFQFENKFHIPDFLILTVSEGEEQGETNFFLKEFYCVNTEEFIRNNYFVCSNNKFLMKKMLETHKEIIFSREKHDPFERITFFIETKFYLTNRNNSPDEISLKNFSSAVYYNNILDLIPEKNTENIIKNEPIVFYFYSEENLKKQKEILVVQFLIPMWKRTENDNNQILTISHNQQSFFPGPSTIVITKEKNIKNFLCEFWYNGVRITEEEMIEKISESHQNKNLTKFIMSYFV